MDSTSDSELYLRGMLFVNIGIFLILLGQVYDEPVLWFASTISCLLGINWLRNQDEKPRGGARAWRLPQGWII